jgi:alcohol dehydrogenase YqhD (iron-dependent ADH family)
MENFTAYNPVRLFFGANVTDVMHSNIAKYGNKALLVYGQGSVKKFGYYDIIISQLKKANIKTIEFSGIKPNPIIDDVYKAVDLCKKEKIDFIVALGGGSVIDSAKIISVAYASNLDPWEIMKYKTIPVKKIPIIVVLTFAGTGSEMNAAAVLQNHKTHEKIGYVNELLFPNEAYSDPIFTKSVSKEQTAYGIVDIISHSLESFFAEGDAPLPDRFVAQLINEIFAIAPLLLKDLDNYEYRSRVLWASTVALNGTLYAGRKTSGDWGVHSIAHVLSYLYDIPHGATLSITYPAWLKFMKRKIPHRIERLGFLLKNEPISADETIDIFEKFFMKINSPILLHEVGLCDNDIDQIKEYLILSDASGMNHELQPNDYDEILKYMA